MNEPVMTDSQLALIRKLARAMGYKEDELGHPYREGKPYEGGDGLHLQLHDFDPTTDPGDAMRVQVFFNLSFECDHDVVVVREGNGPLLMIYTIDDPSAEGRMLAVCQALANAAVIQLSRQGTRKSASVDA